jgi:ribosomal protein L11 methyltransferase
LTIDVPAALEDELAARLGEGSLGVETLPRGAERCRLVIYLPSDSDRVSFLDRARSVVLSAGADLSAAGFGWQPIQDGRWVEVYQAKLGPRPLGERFVVDWRGRGGVEAGRRRILLVPGRAFGTGEHPTTRLCVGALEREVRDGSRWIDLGTGSGVLAVVAALCGASDVLALDNDPEAVAVAAEVVAANGVASAVRVAHGSLAEAEGAPVDGIVANIASSFFMSRSHDLAARLKGGGTLLASGFLEEDAADIEDALRVAGLRPRARRTEGPWALLTALRER